MLCFPRFLARVFCPLVLMLQIGLGDRTVHVHD